MKQIIWTKEKGRIDNPSETDLRTLTLHRVNGPAYQSWHDNGQLQQELYVVNGKMHREDGYANLYWERYGKLTEAEYWLDNVEFYTKEKYENEMFKRKVEIL